MKKYNRKFSVFTLVLLFASFIFAPVNMVMADEAGPGKTTTDADKKKGKDGKGKAQGKDDEEPDCE